MIVIKRKRHRLTKFYSARGEGAQAEALRELVREQLSSKSAKQGANPSTSTLPLLLPRLALLLPHRPQGSLPLPPHGVLPPPGRPEVSIREPGDEAWAGEDQRRRGEATDETTADAAANTGMPTTTRTTV